MNLTRRASTIGAVLAVQAALVGAAVGPQLSARISGAEVRLEVGVVDPVDPFRGAYVDLGYPGLPRQPNAVTVEPVDPSGEGDTERRGAAYVPLVRKGDLWVGTDVVRERPDGLYLACNDGDWRLRCGIESWFLPQRAASAIGPALRERRAIAVVRIDRWGNAALVRVETG
ncbi:MAG: GDYXXLXY domain-containing protein [Dermatophilaceae bacterium]